MFWHRKVVKRTIIDQITQDLLNNPEDWKNSNNYGYAWLSSEHAFKDFKVYFKYMNEVNYIGTPTRGNIYPTKKEKRKLDNIVRDWRKRIIDIVTEEFNDE